ncbi:MAG: histidine--tRNA ligase [Candidatus Aenigmatarchaeota archaeon]
MTFQPPKGMRDLPPQTAAQYNYVLDKLREVFERYGFMPLDTPVLEDFALFAAKGGAGEAIRDEIYCFKDKSDRELALRFEFTASLARFILNNPTVAKPFKRWQAGKVWRYENPQAMRYREFWQADVDIIGSPSPLADVECLACFCECMRALGFKDFRIRVNDRKAMENALSKVVPKEKIGDAFRAIDKLEKIGKEAVSEELKGKGLDAVKVLKAIELKESELLGKSKELQELMRLARLFGIEKNLKIDFSLVRGLEYYTGLVFEVYCGADVSCGGGGRYDNLIKSFGGPDLPATGISFGVSRLVAVMEERGMFNELKPRTVFVAPVNDSVRDEALRITALLREKGVRCETDLLDRKLPKQLEYASALGLPYVIVVGPKELEKKSVRLRDMNSGKEKDVKIEQLAKEFL